MKVHGRLLTLKVIDLLASSVYNTYLKSSEIIKLLKKDGWFIVNIRGSHHQFKHGEKKGKVTVPHPKSELPAGTVNSILKQAGLK